MLVKPGRYSPATAPVIVRRRRRRSGTRRRWPGSRRSAPRPAACRSSATRASRTPAPSASMRSASFSSSVARSFGAVRAQPSKAASAAFTAASTCPREASGTFAITLPVAGFSTSSSLALARDQFAVDQQFGLHWQPRWMMARRLPRSCAALFVRPGQVVREQDRHQRHEDHDDRDDVGDRPLARPEQLVVEPDRQRLLVARP